MRQILVFTLLLCVFIPACTIKKSAQDMEGDLYYPYFRMANFYGESQARVDTIKKYLDTAIIGNASGNEKALLERYAILKKENLAYSPYVYVKLNNDSIIVLYMDKKAYANITPYRYEQLQADHKKVRLQFVAVHLGFNMFSCKTLTSANAITGQTEHATGKFRKENYQ